MIIRILIWSYRIFQMINLWKKGLFVSVNFQSKNANILVKNIAKAFPFSKKCQNLVRTCPYILREREFVTLISKRRKLFKKVSIAKKFILFQKLYIDCLKIDKKHSFLPIFTNHYNNTFNCTCASGETVLLFWMYCVYIKTISKYIYDS